MGGTKHDAGKPPMELLSHHALVEIAKVFGEGAKKYERFNYRGGIAFNRLIGAAHRHLGAFSAGEDLDPETGLSHVAHLGCCAIMLLDMLREHPELDDRYRGTKNMIEPMIAALNTGTQKAAVSANVQFECHYCVALALMWGHKPPQSHYVLCPYELTTGATDGQE